MPEWFFCWPPTARHKPILRVNSFSIETLLEKRKVSFASGCQLELASGLGLEEYIHFSL